MLLIAIMLARGDTTSAIGLRRSRCEHWAEEESKARGPVRMAAHSHSGEEVVVIGVILERALIRVRFGLSVFWSMV